MTAFDSINPPAAITNPKAPQSYVYQEYPRWLHKFDTAPIVVTTDDEKAAKLAEGWALQPVLVKPATSRFGK